MIKYRSKMALENLTILMILISNDDVSGVLSNLCPSNKCYLFEEYVVDNK